MIVSVNNESLKKQDLTASVFTQLIVELKKHGVSNAAASKALGKATSTLNSWMTRGSGPKQQHIDALLEAFPVQLLDKAIELELEPSMSMANSDEIIKELTEVIERQEKELNLYNAAKDELEKINQLKKENALLKAELRELKKR